MIILEGCKAVQAGGCRNLTVPAAAQVAFALDTVLDQMLHLEDAFDQGRALHLEGLEGAGEVADLGACRNDGVEHGDRHRLTLQSATDASECHASGARIAVQGVDIASCLPSFSRHPAVQSCPDHPDRCQGTGEETNASNHNKHATCHKCHLRVCVLQYDASGCDLLYRPKIIKEDVCPKRSMTISTLAGLSSSTK